MLTLGNLQNKSAPLQRVYDALEFIMDKDLVEHIISTVHSPEFDSETAIAKILEQVQDEVLIELGA